MISKTIFIFFLCFILIPPGLSLQTNCEHEKKYQGHIIYLSDEQWTANKPLNRQIVLLDDGVDPTFMDDGLDQYCLYQHPIGLGIVNQEWIAQSFIPKQSALAAVKVCVGTINESAPHQPLIMKIRKSLNGSDLVSVSKPSSEIPPYIAADFIKFNFSPINVTPGDTYYIILGTERCPHGYGWQFYENEDPLYYDLYENGNGFDSLDSGFSWYEYDWVDFGFKTYFCPPAEQIDQQFRNLTIDTRSTAVYIRREIAQEFIPQVQFLSKIDLRLKIYEENTAPVTLIIRNNLTGEDLTSCSVPSFNVPLADWRRVKSIVSFDFPDISVTPDTSYYIILKCPYWDGWYWYNEAYSGDFYAGKSYQRWENSSWREWDRDFWFKSYGYNGSPPHQPVIPSGASEGKINTAYMFSTNTSDPDGHRLKYCFDWGDGLYSWTCYNISTADHIWTKQDVYNIKVKAKDESGAESDWSDPLPIRMPKNKATNSVFQQFFEQHPHMFPILQYLLRL